MTPRSALPLLALVLVTAGCGVTSAGVTPVVATSPPTGAPAAAVGGAALGGAAPSGLVGVAPKATPTPSRAPLRGAGSFHYVSPGLHLLLRAPASAKTALVRSVNAYRVEVGASHVLMVSVDVDNATRSAFALRGFALTLPAGTSVPLMPLSAYASSWLAAAKGVDSVQVLADGTRLLSQLPTEMPAGSSGTLLLATHTAVTTIDGVTYDPPGPGRPIALIPHWEFIR